MPVQKAKDVKSTHVAIIGKTKEGRSTYAIGLVPKEAKVLVIAFGNVEPYKNTEYDLMLFPDYAEFKKPEFLKSLKQYQAVIIDGMERLAQDALESISGGGDISRPMWAKMGREVINLLMNIQGSVPLLITITLIAKEVNEATKVEGFAIALNRDLETRIFPLASKIAFCYTYKGDATKNEPQVMYGVQQDSMLAYKQQMMKGN